MYDFKSLLAYQKAFALAMQIFHLTKTFPKEETYALTDQVRRSSRSVCSCIAEAYRKRQYDSYFISKTSDADMENSETQVWLDFSLKCNYISTEQHEPLTRESKEIGRLLNDMMLHPEKYRNLKNK